MKSYKNLMLLFLLVTLTTIFSSCTNVYYIGQTSEPVRIYSTEDTSSLVTYTVPIGSRVLTKKRSKKYHYILYETYTGYAYNPLFSNYHKYNSSIDGDLYGYSSNKSRSTSYSSSSSRSSSSGGPVHVKGYTKKNGAYVAPHTRTAPTRRH